MCKLYVKFVFTKKNYILSLKNNSNIRKFMSFFMRCIQKFPVFYLKKLMVFCIFFTHCFLPINIDFIPYLSEKYANFCMWFIYMVLAKSSINF